LGSRFRLAASAPLPARGLLVVAVAAVLVATLLPTTGEKPDISLCLVCGERGLSDALANVLLYMPLGAAMALCGWARPRALIAPPLLSASIEFAQTWIPGRDPSLGDVTFNTLGAAVGLAVVATAPLWLAPRPRVRLLLSGLAALAAVAAFAATGILLQPDPSRSPYWGQWTPDLGYLEWYRGRVVSASLGPRELPSGPLGESGQVRGLLLARAPLDVHAVAGPRVPALASLFSIYDAGQREIALLGPDRDDFVFRYRTRAAAALLDEPDLRAVGALRGVTPGESLAVAVRADGRGYCLVVNGRAACGRGFTLGSGWAVLYYPEMFPQWLKLLLDEAWVAGLLVPLGFWLQRRPAGLLLVAAAAAALWVTPAATGLVATPFGELAGAGVGLGLGVALRRLVSARSAATALRESVEA